MIDDAFGNAANSLTAPCVDCFEITPDDGSDLPRATKAIYVGNGGDIVLRAIGSDTDVTLRNAITGSIIDIRVRAIRATGTDATDLVGLV